MSGHYGNHSAQDREWFNRSHKWVLDVLMDHKSRKDKINLFRDVQKCAEEEPKNKKRQAEDGGIADSLHPSVIMWLRMRELPECAVEWAVCTSDFECFTLPKEAPPKKVVVPPQEVAAPEAVRIVSAATAVPAQIKLFQSALPGWERQKEQYDTYYLKGGPKENTSDKARVEKLLGKVFIDGSALADKGGLVLRTPKEGPARTYVLDLVKKEARDAVAGKIDMAWRYGDFFWYSLKMGDEMEDDDAVVPTFTDLKEFLEHCEKAWRS